ncbi:MAG: sigma 54-interacting transcriptional regulator [Candidatus Brocadiae bacterium]|nr:sigma 54-interacting transcriptional regulator [Candidatus Brocadiia bacterium]
MPKLAIVQGPGKGSLFEIDHDATIGRSRTCSIQVDDKNVSRTHAKFELRAGVMYLRDAGSRNGLLVNGTTCTEKRMESGDRLQLGHTVFVYEPDFEIFPGEDSGGVILVAGESEDARASGEVTAALDVEAIVREHERAAETAKVRRESASESAETDRRLRAIYEVTRATTTLLDEHLLLGRIVEVVMELLKAERGAVFLCQEDGSGLHPGAVRYRDRRGSDIAVSKSVLEQVVKDRRAVLTGDASTDTRFMSSRSIRLDRVKSILCAPLISREKLLGVLYVDTQNQMNCFTEEDLALLVNISGQAGIALENARLYGAARDEANVLRKRVQEEMAIVGESPAVRDVLRRIEKVADSDATALVTGETGSGKELVAHAIHLASRRRARPFIPVDCTAISEHLLESELFGHEKGAFTGADRMKPGKFELADHGTLFLDEIGDMDQGTQQKLLRVLEERTFTRVGGVKLIKVDVRIVAATNRNLEEMVSQGKFREDLYYRLAVVPIHLPPLRDRRMDTPILVAHFLRRFQKGPQPMKIADEAMKVLMNYAWPGNVREMRNVIERATVLCEKPIIDVEDLPPKIVGTGMAAEVTNFIDKDLPLSEIVAEVERTCIQRAMSKAKGKKIEAARILQISRPTLDKKLKDYGIEV